MGHKKKRKKQHKEPGYYGEEKERRMEIGKKRIGKKTALMVHCHSGS